VNHQQLAELYLADTRLTRVDGQWFKDAPLSQEALDLEILRLIKREHHLTPAQRVSGYDIRAVRVAMQAILEPELADLFRAFGSLPGARQGLTAAQVLEHLGLAPNARAMGQMLGQTRGLVVDGHTIRMELPEVGPRVWRLENA
jgi:hypothetical protein